MEMSQAVKDGILLVAMLLAGICTGAAYDGLRIFRKLIPHQKKWVDREDLVFWICAGLLFFDELVRQFEGEIRIGCLLAAVAGYMAYEVAVSPFFVKAGVFLLGFPVRLLGKLFFFALRCIKWLKYQAKRGRITLYGHFARICKRKNDRGERKHNGESRI